MAVPEQTPYKEYTANGSTTSFALGFICDSKNDLIVLVDGVAPPVATWSLIGANAVFTTAPASGKKIVLQRNTAMSRTTNYQSNNNSFRPETINKDIDRVWLKLQELVVADMLLKIYVDRLHGEQKDYIDNKDQLVRNIISDLRNYVNQQDNGLVNSINNLHSYVDQQDNNRNSYFENLISRQGVSLQQLDNYYKHLLQGIANIAAEKGWLASLIVDASGKNQQEINNYSSLKFKETPSPVDFPSIADGLKNVVNGVVNLKLLDNTYDLTEEITLGRGHNIRGNGDYSVIKAPSGGTALKYKYAVGTLPYTHFGRVLENLRILGDGVNPTDTNQGGGTTTGYHQDASGHHGLTQQVTFDRHNIGMRINNAYVNSALNNFYRGNEVGLLLEGVTSHTEYSPYVRGNKTAGIKITGYMQNVHIVGGAAENNLGRAIWCTDLTETGGSIKRLTLDDVYTEGNGNAATGVPAIEIDYHDGMHVDVRGGVYSYTSRSGVLTGAFKWGNSVSINGSQMLGLHYAKTMKIENVWFGARLNTSDSQEISVINGLFEPVVLKGIHCNSYSEVNGPIFQPYNLELSKISEVGKYKSTAVYTYPFGAQVSGTTVRVSDSTHDFGAGAWLKATFLDVGGNNANYLELTNVQSEDIGKVLTFALRADRDMSIGIIATGSKDGVNNQTHQTYFELKANKTYVLSSLAFKSTGGVVGTNQRYRLFSTSGAGSISYFPLFACTTTDVFEAFKIADNLCKGTNIKYDASVAVNFNPPMIPAGQSVVTTVTKKGVKVGDVVQATFSIYDASIELSAVVSAVDEVTVSFKNTGESPVDLSSGNISIFV